MSADMHVIKTDAQLRSIIGEPIDFVRAKIGTSLNETMKSFVARSPLLFLSTIDAAGNLDVSPKGDPPGFVTVAGNGDLLIPERPGNRLAFGFENILRNGRIGLIFIVPNQLETLRVKGSATLRTDPDVLQSMEVRGKPALLFTRVCVEECFFHCGKALVRSHLWQPDEWNGEKRSIAARQLMPGNVPDEEGVRCMEAALERSYRDDLY
jgi:PPOX class probable FMN-dependent enzyme